ncbi:glycosyltransferase [Algicola sagamiensis]|uniref:glycosyltransferase n=1 Tax=Algicola sagamiensis TaxID=163869 RepID=UPI0003A051FA|nr:glycosyltransferase [Algicola sagamiensis]
MRIGFFVRDLKIEGVQIVSTQLAQHLAKLGHQCDLICLQPDQQIDLLNTVQHHVIQVPGRFKSSKAAQFKAPFLEWLHKEEKAGGRFDTIFCGHEETIDIAAHIDDSRFVPCIHNSYEFHYEKRNWLKRLRFKQKYKKKFSKKHVICVSQGIKDFCQKVIPGSFLSITTIYNPFEIESIRQAAMEPTHQPVPKRYLLFVGRLELQKQVNRLIEALPFVDSQIDLVILGEGSLEQELRTQVKQLSLSKRVHFLPFTNNPYPIMRNAELLILTSIHEGFGNVLVESLICETPILSTNCPSGPAEIMTGCFEDNLIHSDNPRDIATGINRALASSRIFNFSKSYARFDANSITKQYIQFIQEKLLNNTK